MLQVVVIVGSSVGVQMSALDQRKPKVLRPMPEIVLKAVKPSELSAFPTI